MRGFLFSSARNGRVSDAARPRCSACAHSLIALSVFAFVLAIACSVPVFAHSCGVESRGTLATVFPASLSGFCRWLQDTEWGTGIRESTWVFPIVEGTHALGISLSVGTLLIIDLRLMGVMMRHERVSQVSNQLMPWSIAGFVVMFITGVLLFLSQAVKAYGSIFFRIKMLLLVLAGINALIFEMTLRRSITTWDTAEKPPAGARIAGILGIVIWAGVIAAGRTMAYNF
jgi:hypothetical protein